MAEEAEEARRLREAEEGRLKAEAQARQEAEARLEEQQQGQPAVEATGGQSETEEDEHLSPSRGLALGATLACDVVLAVMVAARSRTRSNNATSPRTTSASS